MSRTLLLPRSVRGSFWAGIGRLRFLVVLLALLLFGDWLGKNFLFEPPSRWLGDILLRTRPVRQERFTRLIRIEAQDQQQVLGDSVNARGLALVSAVCSLARHAPASIVVDIDTSNPALFPDNLRLPKFPATVVWAVAAEWRMENERLALQPGRLFGGRLRENPLYAIARMPTGFDGMVRGWHRDVSIGGHPVAALPHKAAGAYCEPNSNCSFPAEPVFANNYLFSEFHLRNLVPPATASPSLPDACPLAPEPERHPRLQGRILVLGGFHPGSDRHETPWGAKYGAELVAMAIEEELSGEHQLSHLSAFIKWLLKLLIAFAIAAIHHFFRPIAATIFTLLFLPIPLLVSALAIFWLGGYDLAVVPLCVGILLEQLATSAEKAEHYAAHAG